MRQSIPMTRGLAVLISLAWAAASPAQTFRAGAFETDITPTAFPIYTSGGFLARSAAFADGTLHARAIALDDGRTKLVLATADSLMIPREVADRIKFRAAALTGIAAERMMVSATHTHSAPPVMGALGTDDNPEYGALFEERVVEAIAGAVRALAPARIGWTVVEDREHTHNRRWIARPDRIKLDPFGGATVRANMHPGYQNPDFIGPSGPVDPGLTVISIRGSSGKPLALLTNYSMHYVGGSKGVSADYFGYYCARLRELSGAPEMVAIQTQGTSGDLHYMDYSRPARAVEMKAYAHELAEVAFAAARRIEHRDTAVLDARTARLTLARRVPDRERLAWAAGIVTRMTGPAPRDQREVYAREQLYLAATPARELVLQALRIGDLAIAAIPNEVYAITGLKLKAQSPLALMNVELANGAEGYIPPPEQHELGGYTTWPARTAGLVVEAEPRIVETLLGLLEQVAGKPRRRPEEARGRYAEAVLRSRPLAYWRGSEFQGRVLADATGNGHNARIEGGYALYLEGPPGKAFSGADVNRGPQLAGGAIHAALPRLGDVYSAEFWFWNGMPSGARAVTGHLLSRGADRLGIGGDGKLFFAGLRGSREIPVRTWAQVAVVREREKVTVYLDGKLEISGTTTAADPGAGIFLGGVEEGDAGLEGRLDEIAIWPRPLPVGDIAARYALAISK